MDFSYQTTFLRSALVKDPFSLGDLGPEDVLRIESQFPNLFDSSVKLNEVGTKPEKPLSRTSCTRIKTRLTIPPTRPKSPCCTCNCCKSKVLSEAKRLTPKESKPLAIKMVPTSISHDRPIRKNANMSNSTTSKEFSDQLFSVGDLKLMIEEVLRDKMFANPPSPQKLTKYQEIVRKSDGSLQETNCNQLRHGHCSSNKESPSYKKDFKNLLLKQEKGPNLTLLKNRSKISSQKYDPKVRSHKTETKLRNIIQQVASNPNTIPSNVGEKQKILQRAISAPGFLRQTILKSRSSHHEKFTNSNSNLNNKKSVKFPGDSKPVKIKTSHSGGIKDRIMEEKKRSDSLCYADQPELGHGENVPKPAIRDNRDSRVRSETISKSIPMSTQIHLKGKKEESLPVEGCEIDFQTSDTLASFQQMKLAKNLASKYEKIGLLKRRKFRNELLEKSMKPFHSYEKSSTPDSEMKTESQKSKVMVDRSPEQPSKTSNVLEKLAKELVYVEVLKHLHDLQVQEKNVLEKQQETYEVVQNKTKNINERPKITSEQQTKHEMLSESIELNNFSTPELTPSSCGKQKERRNYQMVDVATANPTETFSEMSTPDLTPSTLKSIPRMTKESNVDNNRNNNDNTDCSEISDFIFSEKEMKTTPKSRRPSPPKEKSESIRVVTPELSSSSKSSHYHSDIIDPKIKSNAYTRKDINDSPKTNSSVFMETPEKSMSSMHNPSKASNLTNMNVSQWNKKESKNEEGRTSASKLTRDAYLSSVTEENTGIELLSSAKTPRLKDKVKEEEKSEMFLLSEGEFVGNVYKSPGEVSLSQQLSRYMSEGLLLSVSNSSSTIVSVDVSGTSTNTSIAEHDEQLSYPMELISTGEFLQHLKN